MIGQIWEVDTIDAFGEHAAFFLDDFSLPQAKALYPRLTIDLYITTFYIFLPIQKIQQSDQSNVLSRANSSRRFAQSTETVQYAKQVP